MKKSAEESIISYLKEFPEWIASARLQRIDFRNKNSTPAAPRTIVRRLEENAEAGGMLEVKYEHGNAYYRIKQEHRKEIHSFNTVEVNGIRMTREVISYA